MSWRKREMRLADIAAGPDPTVVLWGSAKRPQLGSAEDRQREATYDREFALFVRAGQHIAARLRRAHALRREMA